MPRKRFALACLGLACVSAASAFGTWSLFGVDGRASPPEREAARAAPQIAPGAVRLVTDYLEALRSGHRATACRLFKLPSVCASEDSPRVGRFTVARAQPSVDGFDVRATIDGQEALFQLASRGSGYRIVEVVVDPSTPGLAAAGYFA